MLLGDDPLHLDRTTIRMALVASAIAALVGEVWLVWHVEEPFDLLGLVVRWLFILVNGLFLARFVSRWLGGRVATATVFALCFTLSVVTGIVGRLEMLCTVGAMYAFARQAIAGRLPIDDSRRTRWVSWIVLAILILCFRWSLGVVIVAIWFLFALVTQNSRLLRRLLNPIGLAIFAVSLALSIWVIDIPILATYDHLRPYTSGNELNAYDFFLLLLPWWPLVLVTLYFGLRHGYYVLPLFQFIVIWLLVTVLAILLDFLPTPDGLIALTPSLAVAVAPALTPLFRLVVRRR